MSFANVPFFMLFFKKLFQKLVVEIELIFINVGVIYMFQRYQSDTVTIVSEIHSYQSVMAYLVSKESVILLEMFVGKNVKQPRYFFLNVIFMNFRGLTSLIVKKISQSKQRCCCLIMDSNAMHQQPHYRLAWIQLDTRGPSPQQIFWRYCLQSFGIHLHYYYF